MGLKIEEAIKVEIRKYKNSSTTIYFFHCLECKIEIIKPEKKYLNKHSGKCRKCVQRGIPFLGSYNHFIDSVKRTNLKRTKQKELNITFEEFLEFTKIKSCHYCNKDLIWIQHTGIGNHRSNLDRKDSSKGYSVENCVVCCKECNILKGAGFSYEEFQEVVNLLDKMRNGTFIKK